MKALCGCPQNFVVELRDKIATCMEIRNRTRGQHEKIVIGSLAVEGESSEENIPGDAFPVKPSQEHGQRPLTAEP